MKKKLTAAIGVVLIALPVANAAAAVRKKVSSVTKTVTGPEAAASQWGYVKVALTVRKTTTTVGAHKTVKRKIVAANAPIYPNHTYRSIFINQQAIPWLTQEVLQAQFNPNIQMVGGATATSYAFLQSLQAALLSAEKA